MTKSGAFFFMLRAWLVGLSLIILTAEWLTKVKALHSPNLTITSERKVAKCLCTEMKGQHYGLRAKCFIITSTRFEEGE